MTKTTVAEMTTRGQFYGSPRAADYFDAMAASGSLVNDRHIYAAAYKRLQESQPHAEAYQVLEVGTGSGRVLINLTSDLTQRGVSTHNAHFYGVDLSAFMLDQAAAYLQQRGMNDQICLLQGSAFDLRALPELASTAGQIDLLILGCGSICHFVGVDERDRFFHEVAHLLRPGTGRAYVSLLDSAAVEDENIEDEAIPQVLPSVRYAGTLYRTVKTDARMEGSVCLIDSHVEVIKKAADSTERVIETFSVAGSCRPMAPDEILRNAAAAGLILVEKVRGIKESFFVFQIPDM